MKTIREQIIERVILQLENMTSNNGYDNDIGLGHIYRQESIIEKGHPGAAVWELSESRARNSYGGTVRVLTIKIEVITQVNGNKHPVVVSNELLGDIERAFIMGDITLDELIDDIQDIAAEIIYLPSTKNLTFSSKKLTLSSETFPEIIQLPIDRKLAGASIDFEISYTTEWGDPYTQ
jgi:hypothetical protein